MAHHAKDARICCGRFCLVEFCHFRYTGGRMLMAPGARIDDEIFDAVLPGPMTPI